MSETHTSSNKLAVIHVLAGLITNPLLFSDNRYRFSITDFPEQFHRIIFGAVEHLATEGLASIQFIDIDEYLKPYTIQYEIYCKYDGNTYIQRALELYDPKKFDYYYQTLKKHSLLNRLNNAGIDTRDIYDPDIVDPIKSAQMYANFDALSVNDIINIEEVKVIEAKQEFGSNSDCVENRAGDGLRELKERFKKTPDMGLPLLSPKLTTILRGQRRGCLFMESAPAGTGKSRRGNAEACHLAIPEYYDIQQQKWIRTGFCEPVLVISTELEEYECQQMWMAFVSGVSEAHIKDGRYAPGEEERVDRAIDLIEKSKMMFVSITNYDVDDITGIIKKYKQLHNITYVYFDYLGETLKITSSMAKQTKIQGLRTDQILLMFSSQLKDLAKTLDIFIWTATQLSGNYKEDDTLDASYLRSAKSLADKVDCGLILVPVREKDRSVIETYCSKGFELEPNFVMHVYKVRAGSYQNIKIYFYFDRATCGVYDCFVTNSRGELLDIADTNIELILDDTVDTSKETNLDDFDF